MYLIKKLIIFFAFLFIVGCTSDATFRDSFLERRSQGTPIPGKVGIIISVPDEIRTLGPSSYSGSATKINFSIGKITKEVALSTYGKLFLDGGIYIEDKTKIENITIVVEPKILDLDYKYNQLKNIGFAITPQVQIVLLVKVYKTKNELLETIFERTYDSGIKDGNTYFMDLEPAGTINKTLHVELQNLMALSFKDFKNKL